MNIMLGDSVHQHAESRLVQAEERRNLAEDALRESEEKYRMLLDGIQDYAIFMMDPRGQIVSWNAGAELVKGYKAEQILVNKKRARDVPIETLSRYSFIVRMDVARQLDMLPPVALFNYATVR